MATYLLHTSLLLLSLIHILYLRRMVLNERADTSGVIFPAYRKSNVQGIVMAFDVRAYANEEYEIDVTDWLQSDTDLLYFSATARGVLLSLIHIFASECLCAPERPDELVGFVGRYT